MKKTITDYDLVNAHESIRIEVNNGDYMKVLSASLFDFLANTSAPKETWIHDPENGFITIAESGTRGTTYTYKDFFKAYHKELEDIFGRYIAAMEVEFENFFAAA